MIDYHNILPDVDRFYIMHEEISISRAEAESRYGSYLYSWDHITRKHGYQVIGLVPLKIRRSLGI